jgi:hypothetical protein
MSTTFRVYPTTSRVPSYQDLLAGTRQQFGSFLRRHTILRGAPALNVRLLSRESDAPIPFDLDAPAQWPVETYAWFTIVGLAGGTDGYFERQDADERTMWLDDLRHPHYQAWATPVHAALEVGHHWRFRRSMGQPASINVLYGLLAAQLALLTDGFIESDDSAWDYGRLPAWPDDFFTWYFDPAAALEPDFAKWARRCIEGLPGELSELV